MFGITATAKASEIRQVWAEIEQKREEIFEEEEAFFDEQTEEELLDFWEQMQTVVLRQSKRMPIMRILRSGCYMLLQVLAGLAVLMMMLLFVVSAFVDLNEMVDVAGKIALALLNAGLCVTAVALGLYLRQMHSEGILRYRIALQQILAENYSLVSDYSEDVNSYAVLMLAASQFSFKTAKQVREQQGSAENGEEETYVVSTEEDVADAQNVEFIERVDETPSDGEKDSSE